MKVDWKEIAIGASSAFAGTVIGMAIVTIVGNLVDGDEVFVINKDSNNFAIIKSCRGGLFAHAHGLEVVSQDTRHMPQETKIQFKILSELGHTHGGPYEVTNDGKIQLSGKDVKVSESGGLHAHGLEVMIFVKNGITISSIK